MTATPDNLSEESGILPVHKPVGPTSRRVVDEVESLLPDCKIGHGGTLDPLAEGVLPLHFNEATKVVPYLHREPKTYRVRVRFDYRSESYDLGEAVTEVDPGGEPAFEEVRNVLDPFEGTIDQVPPKYSAIRSDGDRLYDLTRGSGDPSPEARSVTCYGLSIVDFDFPALSLEIHCGKGFYVRSLVRDLATALGLSGGLVTALVRSNYGPYKLDRCARLDRPEEWPDSFEPPRSAVVNYPAIECGASTIDRVSNGGWIDRSLTDTPVAMALGPEGRLHAILEATRERGSAQWRPKRVLNRNRPGIGAGMV